MSLVGEAFIAVRPQSDDFEPELGEGVSAALDSVADDVGQSVDAIGEDIAETLGAAGVDGGEAFAEGVEGAAGSIDASGPAGEAGEEAGGAFAGGLEDAASDVDVDVGGAFDGIADAAAGAAGDAADAFGGLGDEIAGEVESGVESAGGSLDGLTERLGSVQGALATAAGGAGLEGFARSQQDSNLAVARMSDRLGENEDAIRGMIDGVTDWTFSSHDAAAGMELLSQRGVDNLDTIEKLLPEWDNFADATGQDFVQAMDDGQRALGAFGIDAEDAGDHMDTLTHMANEVNVPMDRLARQVRGNEEELDALGIGLDESAGLLTALGEKGMDGRDAVALFGRSLKGAEGDMDALLNELGLTAEEFEQYTGQVQDAEGITERQAQQANDTATPMERLGGVVENLSFRFGNFGEMAGMLAAPLGAIGPAMFAANQAGSVLAKMGPALGKALGGVTRAFNVLRVAILTNPIFLIAAIIIGIVAVIWYFRDEIIAGLKAAWDWIKDTAGAVWEWLSDTVSSVVDRVVEFVSNLRDRVAEFFTRMVEFVREYHPLMIAYRLAREWVPRIIAAVVELATRVVDTVRGWVDDVVGWVTDLWTRWVEMNERIGTAVREWIAGLAASVIATVTGWVNDLIGWVTDLRDQAVELVGNLRDRVVEFVAELVASVVSTVTSWVSDVLGFVTDLRDDFTSTISDLVDDVLGFFRDLPGNIMSALGDLSTLLLDAGRDIVSGLIDGVTGMAGAAGDAILNVGRGMLDSVTGFFGISSPSKVFAGFGGDLMDGLADGIDDEQGEAVRALEQVARAMSGVNLDVDSPEVGATGQGPAGRAQAAAQDAPLVGGDVNIYSVDPKRSGDEVLRKLREKAYLGATLDGNGRVG